MTDLTFRFAERKDIPLILRFIKELADYEGLLSEVVATEEILETWIFDKEKAEVLLAVDKSGEEIGFALFFHNFSTFLGRAGIYLEDLYVSPFHRVLSLLRGGTYVRLDGIPSCRRYPEKNGRRLSTKKAENSHTGNFLLFFFYFKRISRTRKNANDPKVTSRNNGKNCGGRFPPKADWNTR